MRHLLFLVMFSSFFLYAEEYSRQEYETDLFSVAYILEAADYAEGGIWQPDWPLDFPPDAFVSVSNDWLAITVNTNSGNCTLRRDTEGKIQEFPFFFQNELTRVELNYSVYDDDHVSLSSLEIINPPDAEILAVIDVLEYKDDFPYIIRVFQKENWYFVLMRRDAHQISEVWLDEEGQLIGIYEHRMITTGYDTGYFTPRMRIADSHLQYGGNDLIFRRSFDSRFLTSGIAGSYGNFTVNYHGEGLPRYWDRRPAFHGVQGFFTYQWDANGFLARLSGQAEGDDSSGDASRGVYIDYRYDYLLDDRGNWVERTEIEMQRSGSYLVPVSSSIISRTIEYR